MASSRSSKTFYSVTRRAATCLSFATKGATWEILSIPVDEIFQNSGDVLGFFDSVDEFHTGNHIGQ